MAASKEKPASGVASNPHVETVQVSQGGGHFESNFNEIAEPVEHFDGKREDRMYRKIDSRLLWILALLYLVAFLDRGK